MKRLVMKNALNRSKMPAFVSGMILGAAIALSSSGFSAGEDNTPSPAAGVLYAIASLAVSTETNASRIVALATRVEHLEETLEEMSGGKK